MEDNKQTPLRSTNGCYIQIAGSKLNLFVFGERRAQNFDGSGYNIFNGLEFKCSGDRDKIINYMLREKLKIEQECSGIILPEILLITKNK